MFGFHALGGRAPWNIGHWRFTEVFLPLGDVSYVSIRVIVKVCCVSVVLSIMEICWSAGYWRLASCSITRNACMHASTTCYSGDSLE